MSEPQVKKAFDITNVVLNVAITVTLAIYGFFFSKAYNKLDETHDVSIANSTQLKDMKDHQVMQDARLSGHDTFLYNLLSQNKNVK